MKREEYIRDCVKECLKVGAKHRVDLRQMTYGIICELRRVGYSEKEIIKIMKDWNERNGSKLSYKDFRQKVESFIKWVFKKDAKAGCKYFKDNGFCVDECKFIQKKRREDNAKLSQEVVCTEHDIEKFLTEYDRCKHSRQCAAVYQIIDVKRIKLGLMRSEVIYISCYEIARELWEVDYSGANPMTAFRLVKELIDSNLLELVEQGKKGTFRGLANGYKLRTPDDVMIDDLDNYED